MNTNDKIDELAAIEHERWASWQAWVHSKMTDEIVKGDPMFCIPVEYVMRWQQQVVTPYSKLSEKEKQSDRDQVMRYWPIIQDLLIEAKNEAYKEAARVVIRRTEIPKDAREPTRDHIVILGEELADRIAELTKSKE